jgi:hypothetical protein
VPLVLKREDFEADGRLTAAVTTRVLDSVEALRARALAARQSKLTQEFAEQARQEGFDVFPQPGQYLILRKVGAPDLIAYPAVGAPSALTYERVQETITAALQTSQIKQLYVLYDNRALLERHLEHLAWLDEHIAVVRGIAVANASHILAEVR